MHDCAFIVQNVMHYSAALNSIVCPTLILAREVNYAYLYLAEPVLAYAHSFSSCHKFVISCTVYTVHEGQHSVTVLVTLWL